MIFSPKYSQKVFHSNEVSYAGIQMIFQKVDFFGVAGDFFNQAKKKVFLPWNFCNNILEFQGTHFEKVAGDAGDPTPATLKKSTFWKIIWIPSYDTSLERGTLCEYFGEKISSKYEFSAKLQLFSVGRWRRRHFCRPRPRRQKLRLVKILCIFWYILWMSIIVPKGIFQSALLTILWP